MKTKVTVVRDFKIGRVDENLFSSFIEHLGRAVYTGIYEPSHEKADGQGFRKDVIALVRELNVSLVRYPGGNFLSGYDWKDGIGPRGSRPVRLDRAWHTIEPNEIGIDEFVDWTKKSGTQVMAAVNMGTGSPQDAGDMVEYCNFEGGTYWSDLRVRNGHREPHGIKYWCVGNEMDGPWQICHLDADDYGKKALEAIKIMKQTDPGIKTVVCGSSSSGLPTYPEWDRIVLERTWEAADYISIHRYFENFGNDDDFLASFYEMDQFIRTCSAICDYVKALRRSRRDVYLSFDEWNIWYQRQQESHGWMRAPRILENRYSLLDALAFGGMAITLLNHADRVKIACLAQLVNVIAPICTEPGGVSFRQTIYFPFRDISLYGRGTALRPVVRSAVKRTEKYGDVPSVIFAAVLNEEKEELALFALNTSKTDVSETRIDLRSFGETRMAFRTELCGKKLFASNSPEKPDAVAPRPAEPALCDGGMYTVDLKPASWNVMRFRLRHEDGEA